MTDAAARNFKTLSDHLSSLVIGQPELVERLLIAVLADGHVLLEGPPGLAKTRAAYLLAKGFSASFQRIQFTPDLLPSDLLGTNTYDSSSQQFEFHPGPLFHQIILADEINRAPAKVQAALLEAMEERQITVGGKTRPLAEPFFVIATQNPIEEEGTYELPAAQLDRFIMRIEIDYPDAATEHEIIQVVQNEQRDPGRHRSQLASAESITIDDLQAARMDVLDVHLAAPVRDYIVRLVCATRSTRAARKPGAGQHHQNHNQSGASATAASTTTTATTATTASAGLSHHIAHPVSPRGSIAFARLVQARAWLHGRDHALPDDVQALAHNALGHRIGLSYRAESEGVNAADVVDELLDRVAVV